MTQDKNEAREQLVLDAFNYSTLEFDLRGGCKGIVKRKENKLIMEVWTEVQNGADDNQWEQADEIEVEIKLKRGSIPTKQFKKEFVVEKQISSELQIIKSKPKQ